MHRPMDRQEKREREREREPLRGSLFCSYLLPNRPNHQKVSGQTHPANSTTSR